MTTKIAIGDLNSLEKGSAARANGGKVDFSLVPWHLFAGMARVLMAGTHKYASWNWTKGMQWSACVGCIVRHFVKWWYLGQDCDPETGEHHLDYILCNVVFLRHYELTYPEGDDRPPAYTGFRGTRVMEWFSKLFDAAGFKERNGIAK
jgi:hypothetical protein